MTFSAKTAASAGTVGEPNASIGLSETWPRSRSRGAIATWPRRAKIHSPNRTIVDAA